jgi:hypothetical protein
MDEGSASSSIPVHERVDRLKLGVCNGSLRNSGKIVRAAEGTQVFKKLVDEFWGRGDEDGCARVVVTSTDPVLLVSGDASVLLQSCASKEATVHVEEDVHGDGITG